MLRLFGPECPNQPVAPAHLPAGDCGAVWIDLLNPTREEEAWAEALIGENVPTREEMSEIEPSSRLYERGTTAFMTMSVLHGVAEGRPSSDPVSFILTDRHLVTIRYVDPRPFVVFTEHAYTERSALTDPLKVLIGLLDAIVDRLADELENSGRELERISGQIFDRSDRSKRRNPEIRYEAIMGRIGAAQRLLTRARENSVSASRVLSFLTVCERAQEHPYAVRHLASMLGDARALDDHSDFQADNLTFLLDASLGMISLEQNFVMKIFSVVAVVLMPPTLIAGIYGMNFKYMPELDSPWGYWGALFAMLLSATVPYYWARRKGWL